MVHEGEGCASNGDGNDALVRALVQKFSARQDNIRQGVCMTLRGSFILAGMGGLRSPPAAHGSENGGATGYTKPANGGLLKVVERVFTARA